MTTDACVPISRLAECVVESADDVQPSSNPHFLVGHVGDGNFHFGYLIDPGSPAELERAKKLNHHLVPRAIAHHGTCTGEHGVGLHKMNFLVNEAGECAIAAMRAIKSALDPRNIVNPGKVFAEQS